MPIKIILITGFLGTGKTTLLNRLIAATQNTRIGVIVNDFGKCPVDGTLVQAEGFSETAIIEIGNGSIFCSCLKDVFANGLKHFLGSGIEYLFVETSGLSDPGSAAKFILSFPELAQNYTIWNSIVLIDVVQFEKILKHFSFAERQVFTSSLALLSKCDLAANEQILACEEIVRQINPLIQMAKSETDFLKSLDRGNEQIFKQETPALKIPWERPTPYHLEYCGELATLQSWITKNGSNLLRAKGTFKTSQGEKWLINHTLSGTTYSKWDDNEFKKFDTGITLLFWAKENEHMKQKIFELAGK